MHNSTHLPRQDRVLHSGNIKFITRSCSRSLVAIFVNTILGDPGCRRMFWLFRFSRVFDSNEFFHRYSIAASLLPLNVTTVNVGIKIFQKWIYPWNITSQHCKYFFMSTSKHTIFCNMIQRICTFRSRNVFIMHTFRSYSIVFYIINTIVDSESFSWGYISLLSPIKLEKKFIPLNAKLSGILKKYKDDN